MQTFCQSVIMTGFFFKVVLMSNCQSVLIVNYGLFVTD